MYDWFFNCQKYTEKCSQSMDHPTPLMHKFFMWLRCLICKDSRNFTEQLNIIREAARMDDLPPDARNEEVHLSEEAVKRLKSAIENENSKSH